MGPSGTFQARLPPSISPPRSKVSLKIRCHPFIHLGGKRLCSQVSSCLRSLHDSDTWFEQHRNSRMKMSGCSSGVDCGFWCYVGFQGRTPKFSAFKVYLTVPGKKSKGLVIILLKPLHRRLDHHSSYLPFCFGKVSFGDK